ncbi:hypothetical protein D5086_014904 [Populus alba]|uniref:Uncharacterized protein n=1 Tax=Populus alba TaxID=43335 RepID=A0ACC4BYU0_POPAL
MAVEDVKPMEISTSSDQGLLSAGHVGNGQLNPSTRSFKIVTESPLVVIFLFQLYSRLLKTNIPHLLPLMVVAISVPSPDKKLLTVVNALIHRCYKYPTATIGEVPQSLKKELSDVCRACFSADAVNKHIDFVRDYKQDFEHDLDMEKVPGQYFCDQVIEAHLTYINFCDASLLYILEFLHGSSFRHLTLIGSDGSQHHFIVQTSLAPNARSDERILQLFRVYMVEDDLMYTTFLEVYENHCARNDREEDLPIMYFKEQLNQAISSQISPKAIVDLRLQAYNEITKTYVSDGIFSQYMYKTLLSDFHPAYDANGMIEFNEPIPFRLTRNMQTFFFYFGIEGLIVSAVCAAAQAQSQHLWHQLAMFFSDELLSWSWRRPPGLNLGPGAGGSVMNPANFQHKITTNVDNVISRITGIAPQFLSEECCIRRKMLMTHHNQCRGVSRVCRSCFDTKELVHDGSNMASVVLSHGMEGGD